MTSVPCRAAPRRRRRCTNTASEHEQRPPRRAATRRTTRARTHTRDHHGRREPAYDRDPLIDRSNPLAPPLARVGDADADEWEVTFGDAYGSHPGLVHGGYVAAVLDHVLGVAALSSGVAAMTDTLTTRFRRPTPLNERLRCVGRVDRVEGRKVYCSATLDAVGTVVAEAEGVYLRVDPDRY